VPHTAIFTNVSLLSGEKAKEIIESGLDEMVVSFYGTDEETYNSTMVNLDFHTAFNNVKSFLRIRKTMKKRNPKIVLQYLPIKTNRMEIQKFFRIFSHLINRRFGDNLRLCTLHNLGGGRDYRVIKEKILSICERPWMEMVILWDGKIVSCCIDFNGLQILGDATKSSLREIWNGPALSRMRCQIKNLDYRDFPVCMQCDRVKRVG